MRDAGLFLQATYFVTIFQLMGMMFLVFFMGGR